MTTFARSYLPRVSTFGIGPYCNHAFLKMLATVGKGQYNQALKMADIKVKMCKMLESACKPILTDITLGVAGLEDVELYPFPIPDLFVNCPVLVTGKFTGKYPAISSVHGVLPSGQPYKHEVNTTAEATIPLDKVFIKQQIDILTAQVSLEMMWGQKSLARVYTPSSDP